MTPDPRPWPVEGVTALGVVVLAFLELLAWNVAPRHDRLLIGAVLAGAAVALWLVYAAARREHALRERARHIVVRLPDTPGEQWFTSGTLEGFPTEAVRPLLEGPDAPDPNRLHTAWVFAAHGYDAAWIVHHLELPASVVRPLVDAAARRRAQGARGA